MTAKHVSIVITSALIAGLSCGVQADGPFDWQNPKARVLPTGGIEWTPEPFVYTPGESVRYIDFEHGDDTADGRTPDTAWQHHPWDANATATAKASQGADTYVFRRGVTYRGTLTIQPQGTADRPIRLTSDPAWGEGEAVITGARRVTGWTRVSEADPVEPDAAEATDEVPTVTADLGDWGTITLPKLMPAERKSELVVELPQAHAGMQLVLAVHWINDAGRRGGYSTGAQPRRVDAEAGKHTFTVTPNDHVDLSRYMVVAYLSPTGGWDDHTLEGRVTVDAKRPTMKVVGAIPEPEKVWFADLDYLPRNVWHVDADGKTIRLPLARTPNWKVVNEDDIKSQWRQFDNPGSPHFKKIEVDGIQRFYGIDTKHLTEQPDYYKGAYIWTEYGWVMGTPYPSRIVEYFPDKHGVAIEGQWGRSAGRNHLPRFSRYYLEDKPHYLDDPDGEFWFDKRGEGGRLYVRLPGGIDPNQATVEAARDGTLIRGDQTRHIEISGLTFRYTNVQWRLDARSVDPGYESPACIRLSGSGHDVTIANCTFEHVNMPVMISASGEGDGGTFDRVVVRDNVIRHTDHGAMIISDGSGWGQEYPKGRLFDVKVLRNKIEQIGMRPTRFGQGHAIELVCPETAEVAGNVLDRLYGAGIFIYGGKRDAAKTDRPLTRILVHHNQVTDPLLNSNDWGGIETWQGGPAYVFNNVSGNPGGYKMWGHRNQPDVPGTSRFGHAYYMDGGFKQYYFNNIAWGKSSDPLDPLGNTAAFQEIHGYLCSVFNNTAYNFVIGSRRQAPVAGRNKYMGNIWQSIGSMVFRHADESGPMADPNAADAATDETHIDYATNAYVSNVFHDIPENFGRFEGTGVWHPSIESFREALQDRKGIGDVGQLSGESLLRDPAKHDFRPTDAAKNKGVKMFVPWPLYATVGEWHFYPRGDDPTVIPDESLYLTPHYHDRKTYHDQPTFPLKVIGGEPKYINGPLEDWTRGALRLDGSQMLLIDEKTLSPEAAEGMPAHSTPRVDESNFLIEIHLRIEEGQTEQLLVWQLAESGYALVLDEQGRPYFGAKSGETGAELVGKTTINDGKWHHLIVEADRDAKELRMYLDGKLHAKGPGLGKVSLMNNAPLVVGSMPMGGGVVGEIDFLRIAHGTLADSKTTIEELYAWQFNGPFLRDFAGREPVGRRDAGAIEHR